MPSTWASASVKLTLLRARLTLRSDGSSTCTDAFRRRQARVRQLGEQYFALALVDSGIDRVQPRRAHRRATSRFFFATNVPLPLDSGFHRAGRWRKRKPLLAAALYWRPSVATVDCERSHDFLSHASCPGAPRFRLPQHFLSGQGKVKPVSRRAALYAVNS